MNQEKGTCKMVNILICLLMRMMQYGGRKRWGRKEGNYRRKRLRLGRRVWNVVHRTAENNTLVIIKVREHKYVMNCKMSCFLLEK